jgi:Zn-dependent M28 family amino/carboxypeptidase
MLITGTGKECSMLSERLHKHVFHLANEIGERHVYRPAALHAAAAYIQQTWQDMGYTVQRQEQETAGVQCANLEVTLTGSQQPDEILLIGAHYDTVTGSPGANDNGSGVACLLELARLLVQARQARSLRFVAFVNEESPFFFTRRMGSMIYADAARQRGDDIRLMLALETLGYYRDAPKSQGYPPLFRFFYPDTANFVAFVSNFRSRHAMRELVTAFRHSCDFPAEHVATFSWIPGVAWSDHLSFWRQGYRAVMVTDTAFYRYPYYHHAEDTADKLDYDRFAAVTQGLYGALCRLAEQGV